MNGRPYVDYEDDETELVPGGDRTWDVKNKHSKGSDAYKEKQRERQRRWYHLNTEKQRERMKKYRSTEAYKERIKLYRAERYRRIKLGLPTSCKQKI